MTDNHAQTPADEEPLIHVGWWCWRGDNHGHLATMACRSDNVPIHVPAEWADGMRAVIQRIEDGDEDDPAVSVSPPATPADTYEQETGHLITCLAVAGGASDPDCCSPATDTPDDPERRDRYAEAMARRDGHSWPTEFEDDERDYYRRADAATAVADAEHAQRAEILSAQAHELEALLADRGRLRADVLREAADQLEASARKWDGLSSSAYDEEAHTAKELRAEAAELRRMAGEEQPTTETAPAPADRNTVLREEAALIRAHCPDHLDSNSAEGSWMFCHCDVADDMLRRAATP